MYPHERSLVLKYADQPFAIVGINSDKDRSKILARIAEENITWRSFFDGGGTGGPIASKWNVSGWPTIYLIDAEGRIRFKNARGDALDAALEELMAEVGEETEAAVD
jgi:hypothetical protein